MIFIDANLFLAYDNVRDVHHSKAIELWRRIETEGLYFTTDYVLNEVVGVTFRKFGKERAIILGENLLKTVFILNIDEHMLQEAWTLFRSTALRLNLQTVL